MSVRVTFEIPDAEYRLLAHLCAARNITLPRLGQQVFAKLARDVEAAGVAKIVQERKPRRRKTPARPKPPRPKVPRPTREPVSAPTAEQLATIRRMHHANSTAAEIGEHLGFGRSKVQYWIGRLGLEPHPRGRRRS